jgi:hypothetical protein
MAALSTDPVFGWGNPGGYIFQKVCALPMFINVQFKLVWFEQFIES